MYRGFYGFIYLFFLGVVILIYAGKGSVERLGKI